METVIIEFSASELAALQRLIDLAIQSQGLKIAHVALAINDKLTNAVRMQQQKQQEANNRERTLPSKPIINGDAAGKVSGASEEGSLQ